MNLFHHIEAQDKTEFPITDQKRTDVAPSPEQVQGETLKCCRCFTDVLPIN